jgi:hypothetical protein
MDPPKTTPDLQPMARSTASRQTRTDAELASPNSEDSRPDNEANHYVTICKGKAKAWGEQGGMRKLKHTRQQVIRPAA